MASIRQRVQVRSPAGLSLSRQEGGERGGAGDVKARVHVRNGLRQGGAGRGRAQLEVRDEDDRFDAFGRTQPQRTDLAGLLVHPGDRRAAEDGGRDVVGVALHLRADRENLLASEHVGVADERAGQRHARDDRARRGTQASRVRDAVRAAHAHPTWARPRGPVPGAGRARRGCPHLAPRCRRPRLRQRRRSGPSWRERRPRPTGRGPVPCSRSRGRGSRSSQEP